MCIRDRGKALTQAAIDKDLVGVIDLQTMKDQAEILKRNPNITIREKQQRTKADIAAEQKAALAEGAKVTRIPADPGAAIKGKIEFDRGTTKREQRYGLEDIASDADIFTELESDADALADEFFTSQGEALGEGFGEVIDRKSKKLKTYKAPSRKGRMVITSEEGDQVTFELKIPGQSVIKQTMPAATLQQKFKDGYYQDYAVTTRASKAFREWAKQHSEYGKDKYWDNDEALVTQFVENFDKLWDEATLAGVKIPNAVTRLESERRSDRDPGVRQIKNKVRDMNTEYESLLGKLSLIHISEPTRPY